jgi:hypothetical protein
MSLPVYKPLPLFAVISPDGECTEIPARPHLIPLMRYDHVVEFHSGGASAHMHHWDCRKQGGAFNDFATEILHLPGITQIKGQKRVKVYGDAFIRFLRDYPCVQTSMSIADLNHEISNHFPGMDIFKAAVGEDLWDVFFLDPSIKSEMLFRAAMVLD